jgi:class 3 adenylate cyclase
LPRPYYARVINELKAAGARVIVFDMLFDMARPGDKAMAQAARAFGKVVWGCEWNPDSREFAQPNSTLLAASPYIGHASSPYGEEYPTIDRIGVAIDTNGRIVPALSIQAARLALGLQDEPLRHVAPRLWSCGKLLIPTDGDGFFRISFFGHPTEALPPVPFDQIYHGVARSGMFRDRGFFKGKIVMIGDLTALGRDFYQTPIGRMSGLEAHAYAVATLLQQSFLFVTPPWFGALMMIALSALTSRLALTRRWLQAALRTFGVIIAYVVGAAFIYLARDIIVPVVAPALTALAAALACMIERGWSEERERVRISTVLQQYVSQQVSDHGAPTGEVALLFTDLEGSTVLSRRFGERFERVRDDHFRILRKVAQQWNGFEVETAGDSIYIVFGNACDAVRFSIDAQRDLRRHKWPAVVGDVRVRMGIHYGQPFVGRDRGRLTYRGPETNRTARVMSSAQGGEVLVTGELRVAARPGLPAEVDFVSRGTFNLKGIGEEVLYQIHHPDLQAESAEPA